MKDLRKYKPLKVLDKSFEVSIGLQTSDNKFFVNHPDSNHKAFKASTLTHCKIAYPYDSEGNYTGEWKAYGRKQGLNQLGVKKIAIPVMWDGKTGFKYEELDENTLVYSGYYITGDLDAAKEYLDDEGFREYLLHNCEPKLHGWYRVSKEVLMSYSDTKEKQTYDV